MAATFDSLSHEIERAERAVYEADERAVGSARALRMRWQQMAPKIMYGLAAAAATSVVGLLLFRSRSAAKARRPSALGRTLRGHAGRAASDGWNQLYRTAQPLLRQMAPRLIATGSALLAGLVTKRAATPALVTAAHVDLERFAGTWNEIARLPDRREKGCQSGITTTYAMTDEGLRIVNRCTRADGTTRRSFGHAEIVPGTGNAKLKVSYLPKLLDILPFVWSDLYIIHVADDYGSAIVGTPDRSRLWLLAREATVDEAVRAAFVTKAQAQSFDTTQLIYS